MRPPRPHPSTDRANYESLSGSVTSPKRAITQINHFKAEPRRSLAIDNGEGETSLANRTGVDENGGADGPKRSRFMDVSRNPKSRSPFTEDGAKRMGARMGGTALVEGSPVWGSVGDYDEVFAFDSALGKFIARIERGRQARLEFILRRLEWCHAMMMNAASGACEDMIADLPGSALDRKAGRFQGRAHPVTVAVPADRQNGSLFFGQGIDDFCSFDMASEIREISGNDDRVDRSRMFEYLCKGIEVAMNIRKNQPTHVTRIIKYGRDRNQDRSGPRPAEQHADTVFDERHILSITLADR